MCLCGKKHEQAKGNGRWAHFYFDLTHIVSAKEVWRYKQSMGHICPEIQNSNPSLHSAISVRYTLATSDQEDYPRHKPKCFHKPVTDDYLVFSEPIGKGLLSTIYKVRNLKDDSLRMVKKLPIILGSDSFLQYKFLAQMDHQNILKIDALYIEKEVISLVGQYCQGGELFDYIIKEQKLSQAIAKTLFTQILKAVEYCHRKSIIHRDLKPENIMFIDKTMKKLKLIDFGGSIKLQKGSLCQEFFGSIYYVAPQVIRRQYNHKCDIWSAGIILYFMLLGQVPFQGSNINQILQQIQSSTEYLQEIGKSQLSNEGKKFIVRLLQMNPNSRPQAHEALRDPWFKTL